MLCFMAASARRVAASRAKEEAKGRFRGRSGRKERKESGKERKGGAKRAEEKKQN